MPIKKSAEFGTTTRKPIPPQNIPVGSFKLRLPSCALILVDLLDSGYLVLDPDVKYALGADGHLVLD